MSNFDISRAVHIDFHTMPGIYNFAENFNADNCAQILADAEINYVNVFVKCNLGFSYFPSEIGIPYPGMKCDYYGKMLRSCHNKGIAVAAYFHVGLDHEMCRRHRDWSKLSKEGAVMNGDKTGHFFRTPCLGTPYRDYLLNLISETIEKYPETDALFLDGINFNVCYGNECLEEVLKSGGNPTDDKDISEQTHKNVIGFLDEVKRIAGSRELVCKGLPIDEGKAINTHIEIENLPSGDRGYDYIPANIAYARTFNDRILYMSGRFQEDWGDFGGLKPLAALEYDRWEAEMSGASGTIFGDHMIPRGELEKTVYESISHVYKDAKLREAWIKNAKYQSEIALITKTGCSDEYLSAARMLGEIHLDYDIVGFNSDLSKYNLVILPDNLRLDEREAQIIRSFAKSGKSILCTGFGGVYSDRDELILSDMLYAHMTGIDDSTQIYYKPYGEAEKVLGTMPRSAYIPGIRIKADDGTKIIANTVSSYYNSHWDGFHGYSYFPPNEENGEAAAVIKDNVCHISFKLFTAYYQSAYTALRNLFEYCVRALLPKSMLTTNKLPHTTRVTLLKNEEFTIVYVRVTYPELRGKNNIIEEHNIVPKGSEICIAGKFESAVSIPDEKTIAINEEDGYTKLILPEIKGCLVIALKS